MKNKTLNCNILLPILIWAFLTFSGVTATEKTLLNPFTHYWGDLRVTLFGYDYVKSLIDQGKIGAIHDSKQFSFEPNQDLNNRIVEYIESVGFGYDSRAAVIFITKRDVFVLPYKNIKYLNGEAKPVDEFVSGDILVFVSND